MNMSQIAFIWPWIGPYTQNMLNMGPWEGIGWGYRYSPSQPTPPSHYPGYTPPLPGNVLITSGSVPQTKSSRGAQIGSSTHFRSPFLRVQGYYRGI